MTSKELIYKPILGEWTQINPNAGDSAAVLADTLQDLGIIIDDYAQFCRIYRYYDNYYEMITYRVINQQKITITITEYNYEIHYNSNGIIPRTND